jgi:hypothetical protein
MLADLDPPDRLQAGMRPAAAVGGVPSGTVPGDEQHLVEALLGLEARVANPPSASLGVADTPEIGLFSPIRGCREALM